MSDSLRVGVAGIGTVGAAVTRLLARQADALASRTGRKIVVTAVSARDPGKERHADLGGCEFFADPVALAASPKIDLFVELIGGAEGPARVSVETALAHGKSVVTANKALLAAHGLELAALAEEKHVALAFEASVAGGIPIVKTLREGLAGNSIERVYGILNGTCNYILSRMEREQLSFEECLAEAQRLGYAEADPTFDIGGFDTAHKLSILTSLAFGVRIAPEAIDIEGIERVSLADIAAAGELGFRIKLLGVAQRTARGRRTARASDDGAQDHPHRRGHGRAQRRHHRRGRRARTYPGRPRRRRRGDGLGGRRRHRRHRQGRALRAVRRAHRRARRIAPRADTPP